MFGSHLKEKIQVGLRAFLEKRFKYTLIKEQIVIISTPHQQVENVGTSFSITVHIIRQYEYKHGVTIENKE